MEREIEILKELREACEARLADDYKAHAFAFVGNGDDYEVEVVGDLDDIGETLYFILSKNKDLLETFSEAVRIASEAVANDDNKE